MEFLEEKDDDEQNLTEDEYNQDLAEDDDDQNLTEDELNQDLIEDDDDQSLIEDDNDNPYEENKPKHMTIKKELSSGTKDGAIIVKINRSLSKYQDVIRVRVKVINHDYEASKYSDEVFME